MDFKERYTKAQIDSERVFIESLEYFKDVFNSISTVSLVLNETRQVVFTSNNFLEMLQLGNDSSILGLRTGEVISCIHSKESPYGCNNSSSCSYCGALQAVLESGRTNTKTTKETRVTSLVNDSLISWDLSVISVPLTIRDKRYFIVTMTDISSEKRKKQLERIFIHDLVNSVGGISGLSEALEYSDDEYLKLQVAGVIGRTSRNILEQVLSYRHLLLAESGELEVKKTQINAIELIQECINIVSNNKSLRGKISLDSLSDDLEIESDRILLSRILINMIKNAMEAEDNVDAEISVAVRQKQNKIVFSVRNNLVIPNDIQKQIFQRSFSTKDSNRGLGTYSMKLLGENYLKGKVGFKSSEKHGTEFFIELPEVN